MNKQNKLPGGWQGKYTEEQLEVIKQAWPARPPAQCTGTCRLQHFWTACCHSCLWTEEEPTDTLDNAYKQPTIQ